MAIESTPKDRGPNVDVESDILRLQTRSFDASALSPAPRMGEWLNCAASYGGAATRAAAGPGTRCVWAERGRSDLQGSGSYKRTPVIFTGSWHGKFRQWMTVVGQANENDLALSFAAGMPLTVAARVGSTDTGLYVLTPHQTGTAYVVGYSLAPPSSQDSALEAYIYDSPRHVVLP